LKDKETPHIEVRAVLVGDAPALYELDSNFETDHIYTLRVQDRLKHHGSHVSGGEQSVFAVELVETLVDPPIYKNFREHGLTLEETQAKLRYAEGGYVALANGQIAGGILLKVETKRSVAAIEAIVVGHQFRRYGIGSLLLSCASDWAREHDCWALQLETQGTNYPAIQFYLRNGLEIWCICPHFYPPGPLGHEISILMGKRFSLASEQ